MTSTADMWALAVAGVVVVAPGAALLLCLGIRRPLWWIAVTPPASVGVATATAIVCALAGVRFGPFALAVATGLLAAGSLLRLGRARWPKSEWIPSADRLPGLALAAAGVALGLLVWTHGLGSMATVGQEHDLIVHGVLTAYIEQTGHAAPWQLLPADVLTGQDVTFYPAGLHLLMAVTGSLTGDTVVGINAVSAIVLGVAWTSGSAALALVAACRARLDPALALVAAGTAAIVAAGLYRPTISLVQWGGTVPNAATLALTPGLLAALLTLPTPAHEPAGGFRSWARGGLGGPPVAVGVAVAGILGVHPSAVVTVGVSVLAWWFGEVLGRDGRRRLLGQIAPLLVAGVVAAALTAPMLLAMSRIAAHIAGFQPDIDPIPLGDALDRTLRLTYNAGDPRQKLASAQVVAGVAALAGVAVLAVTRRALGAVAAWLAWVVIVTATWVRPGRGLPGKLTDVFYDAQIRVWSHASLFVPTVAAVGLAVGASLVATRIDRVVRATGTDRAAQTAQWAPLALAGVLALAYLAGPGYRYGRTDVESLASRYARPAYTRVSASDRRAVDWLAGRVAPGERVLNSANDGSTLLYVDRRVPIVNVASLGSAAEPATYRLLQGFNRYPLDAEVRRMLRELDVRWIYVDTSAPTVSASGAPDAWAGEWLSVPDGLRGLGTLPGLERRFRSGSVSIYHLDPAALAEPAESAEPVESGTPSGQGWRVRNLAGVPQGFQPPPYPYDRLDVLREVADRLPGGCVDLSIGTPCDPAPPAVVAALSASHAERGYPPSVGTPALRTAITGWMSRRFGVDLDPAHVAACVGTKELVAGIPQWLSLRTPDRDTVLYPEISYPTYAMGATLARCRPVPYGTLDDIDPADAARALCLWVNSPANPTGALTDLAAAAAWGRERGVPVFSDECYIEFTWDGPGRTILSEGTEGVVALHSLSKRSNLAGVRVGFYAGDPELVHYLSEVRKHAGFMVPGPAQAAAVVALGDDQHVDEQRERYLRRMKTMATALRTVGVDCDLPAGAFYLWAPAPSPDHDAWKLAADLAERGGALVAPGDLYGPAGAGYVRIAVVQPDDRLDLVADRLA